MGVEVLMVLRTRLLALTFVKNKPQSFLSRVLANRGQCFFWKNQFHPTIATLPISFTTVKSKKLD